VNSSGRSFDVVIAGAGIVGSACAWELARLGLKVAVADSHIAAGGATAAGMGHVVVMDDSDAQFRLTAWSRRLWRSLRDEWPAGAEYTESGTLWIAADEQELAEARRKAASLTGNGCAASLLDEAGLRSLEPNLRPGLAGALLVPEDCVVYAPGAARWMLDHALALGADFVDGNPVDRWHGFTARLRDGTTWSARVLINAAGADAPRLTPGLPVLPRKGHLVVTDRAPGFLRHQVVELGYLKSAHSVSADSVAFNLCPRPTGQLLIGSSRQYGVTHSRIDRPILEAMLARAFAYAPALRQLNAIRCWTGFRAATPDKLPLIGPHPHIPGLWLATGHEGLGITTALATAKLIAAQITGTATEIPATPYLPARFDLPAPPPASGRPLPGSPAWERPDWPSSASANPSASRPAPGSRHA
jgi:glycine/D-amino acid oxidase-like deaminating enzyme